MVVCMIMTGKGAFTVTAVFTNLTSCVYMYVYIYIYIYIYILVE